MILRSANIILYDEDNRFLLQHRTNDASTRANFWGLFGGGIEGNETELDALKREACEELEYKVRNPKKLVDKETDEGGQKAVRHVYYEECYDKSSLRLGEGQGWGWYTLPETRELLMDDSEREILSLLEQVLYLD